MEEFDCVVIIIENKSNKVISMEMVNICICGEAFDLAEGLKDPDSNNIICQECYEEKDKNGDISDLLEDLNVAIGLIKRAHVDIEDALEELNTLGYDGDLPKGLEDVRKERKLVTEYDI